MWNFFGIGLYRISKTIHISWVLTELIEKIQGGRVLEHSVLYIAWHLGYFCTTLIKSDVNTYAIESDE